MEGTGETIFLRKHVYDKVDSKRTSHIEDYLSEEEREFLWLVQTGDLEAVRDFLEEKKMTESDLSLLFSKEDFSVFSPLLLDFVA
ncbi:short transient receptor potential channel 5 [Trichonephila clavata]|uniref:Short transient receptor potential channel 5 n=1 Tax=Trichonephila clavata TaxID=2740835 RepID=A0A8X6K2C0_TRICU|nr:short transient receptor potential channel 5 [Trichonephila clavata]